MFFKKPESKIKKYKEKRDINKLVYYFFCEEVVMAKLAKKALRDLMSEEIKYGSGEEIYKPIIKSLVVNTYSTQKISAGINFINTAFNKIHPDYNKRQILVNFILETFIKSGSNNAYLFERIIEVLFKANNCKSCYAFGSYYADTRLYNLAIKLDNENSESVLCCGTLTQEKDIINKCLMKLKECGGILALKDMSRFLGMATLDLTSVGGYADEVDQKTNQGIYNSMLEIYNRLNNSEQLLAIEAIDKMVEEIICNINDDTGIVSTNILRLKLLLDFLRSIECNDSMENHLQKMKKLNHKAFKVFNEF